MPGEQFTPRDHLRDLQRRIDELSARVGGTASRHHTAGAAAEAVPQNAANVECVATAEQVLVQGVIDDILSLKWVGPGSDFALDIIQANARSLRTRLALAGRYETSQERHSLTQGDHPWRELLHLVRAAAARWPQDHDLVRRVDAALHSDLGTAAAAGRIRRGASDDLVLHKHVTTVDRLVDCAIDDGQSQAARVQPDRDAACSSSQPRNERQPVRSMPRLPDATQDVTWSDLFNNRLLHATTMILSAILLISFIALGLKAGVEKHLELRTAPLNGPAPAAESINGIE